MVNIGSSDDPESINQRRACGPFAHMNHDDAKVECMDKFTLSVVLPIRNEEVILRNVVDRLAEYFDRHIGPGNWQFVLAENGSSDRSPDICRETAERWPGTVALFLGHSNFGHAIRAGILAAEGSWLLTMDVDHVWDPPFFEWSWRHREDYHLILGSKRVDPTLNDQNLVRRILSSARCALLNYLFDLVATDTHGMKLMRADVIKPIAEACKMRRGQFQTELTLRVLRARLWVAEIPTPYAEIRQSRNTMIRKVCQNIWDMFRTYRVLKSVPYQGTLRYRRFCREDMLFGDDEAKRKDTRKTG